MNITTDVTVGLIIACIFGVFAFVFFEPMRKNRKSLWMSVHAAISCGMSFNYVALLLVNSSYVKNILFTVHIILVTSLFYGIYEFTGILTNKKDILHYRILGISLGIIFLITYFFYPFTDILKPIHKISWARALPELIRFPSFIIFSIYFFLLMFIGIRNLFLCYKNLDNPTRLRMSSLFVGIVLLLGFLTNILNLILLYSFKVVSMYYDLAIITTFLFSFVIIICQRFFYILEISPNLLIYKMIDKIPECVVVVDFNLHPVWWNKMFEDMFSEFLSVPKNLSIHDFIFPSSDGTIFKSRTKLQTKLKINSEERDILFTGMPIRTADGVFAAGVYYLQDVTSFEKRKNKIACHKKKLESKIIKRTHAIKQKNIKLKKLISEKIEQEENNFLLLNFDNTTKLYNRKSIMQKLDALISKKDMLYVLYVDIDDMKMLNDSFGHEIVNKLIVEIATRMTSAFEHDNAIARFSGDEFLIILDKQSDIHTECLNLQHVLAQPFFIDDVEIKITVSIGVSVFPNDGIDAATLIRFADMAMYQAKEKGKNCISYFDTSLKDKIETDFFVSEKLKTEILNSTMNVVVEPVIQINDDGSRHICSFETVICWYYDFNRFLNETMFLDIARKAGILKKFDRWLLNTTIKKASENNFFNMNTDFKLMITLSEQSFFSPIFFDYILETLNAYNVKPDKIEIEITEETLMLNPDLAIKNINQCQQFGIGIGIKNFGVSYSSLSYLNKLNFDKIKISKIFVSEIGNNLKDEGIIKLLIALSSRINIDVIAEGVDSTEQFKFLFQVGCRKFQGKLFAKPMVIDAFLKIIDSDFLIV